jgi:hypothetical protein
MSTSGDEIPITYIPASDAVVFRTSMLTRVAEGQEVVAARREEGETLARRAAVEETVEQARRRSRSKSVERTQVPYLSYKIYRTEVCYIKNTWMSSSWS